MAIPSDPTTELLRLYLSHLSEPMGFGPHRTAPAKPRARAGKSTRGFFSSGLGAYRSSQSVWREFTAIPLDRIWVWSDLHLGHANIIKYSQRPMYSVDQMDSHLLDAAQIVPNDDFLLFGGDLALSEESAIRDWLELCPGRKLLILGNHDKGLVGNLWNELGFEAASPCLAHTLASPQTCPVSSLPVSRLWWTHYPLCGADLPPGVVNIHGHIHNSWLPGPLINLSVEKQGYAPRRLSDVLAIPRID